MSSYWYLLSSVTEKMEGHRSCVVLLTPFYSFSYLVTLNHFPLQMVLLFYFLNIIEITLFYCRNILSQTSIHLVH